MANRPCKPDADLKQIWQRLLPDTPMPACGTGASGDADASKSAELVSAPRGGGRAALTARNAAGKRLTRRRPKKGASS
jgi:hypothetical protein